jgi:hypothetical protein
LSAVRRLLPLALLAALAAGCGSSKHAATTSAPAAPPRPGPGRVLYQGGPWSVVLAGTKATALHLAGGAWRADHSGTVQIRILAPRGKATPTPQVAVELKAPTKFVETGLWVDGHELLEKGGGLKPTNVTIYGSPDGHLKKGRHVAVAYGRTATSGGAVAWVFTV